MLGPLPFVLVVNKADLRDQWEVQSAQVAQYGWPTFETSAKAGSGVEEMFLALGTAMIRGHPPKRGYRPMRPSSQLDVLAALGYAVFERSTDGRSSCWSRRRNGSRPAQL